MGKQLVERVVNDWQIEPERYQKSLSDSAEVVARYTRWAVTGALMQELTREENPDQAASTWQAAKAVRRRSVADSAKQWAAAVNALIGKLVRVYPPVEPWYVLLLEHVTQEAARGQPNGRLRTDFLALLKASRATRSGCHLLHRVRPARVAGVYHDVRRPQPTHGHRGGDR